MAAQFIQLEEKCTVNVIHRNPILLAARSTVDFGPDALVRAGIADLVRRPFASAELAAALSRSLRSTATP